MRRWRRSPRRPPPRREPGTGGRCQCSSRSWAECSLTIACAVAQLIVLTNASSTPPPGPTPFAGPFEPWEGLVLVRTVVVVPGGGSSTSSASRPTAGRRWRVAFYVLLTVVYAVFVVSTIPGVRREPGY